MWTGPKEFGLVQNHFGPIKGQGGRFFPKMDLPTKKKSFLRCKKGNLWNELIREFHIVVWQENLRANMIVTTTFKKYIHTILVHRPQSLRKNCQMAAKVPWDFMISLEYKLWFEMKSTKLYSKILLVKTSENNFIFLPAFYLIMCLMKASNNFGKIAIMKIWELDSLKLSKFTSVN